MIKFKAIKQYSVRYLAWEQLANKGPMSFHALSQELSKDISQVKRSIKDSLRNEDGIFILNKDQKLNTMHSSKVICSLTDEAYLFFKNGNPIPISEKIREKLKENIAYTSRDMADAIGASLNAVRCVMCRMKKEKEIYIESYEEIGRRDARFAVGNNKDAMYFADRIRKKELKKEWGVRKRAMDRIARSKGLGPFSSVASQLTKRP